MKLTSTLCAAGALFLACTHAHGQHDGDVALAVQDGKVVTGEMHDGVFEPHQLWIEGIDGRITDHPGYDAPSGALPPSATAGIAVRKALRAWDYDGGHFLDIPQEAIVITRFALSVETPPSDPQPGDFPSLPLGVTSASGSLHVHPWYELTAPAGSPADGMYLLELEFWLNGVETSQPFWIIFTKSENDSEVIHEAEEWVMNNLIDPSPTKCPADLTGSGSVGVPDLLALLAAWGPCADPPAKCPADLTGSGGVGVPDLLALLAAWGNCPE